MSGSARIRRSAPRRRSRSCDGLGTPLLIHQPSYSMLNRWIEQELLDVLERDGVGAIVFSPLAQGLLTDRYLHGIPEDSRAAPRRGIRRAPAQRREPRARARAERDRDATRPVARAARDRVGAARSAHQLGADRRQQRRTARAECRGARERSTSAPRNSPRSIATPSTAASTCGRRRAAPDARSAALGRLPAARASGGTAR